MMAEVRRIMPPPYCAMTISIVLAQAVALPLNAPFPTSSPEHPHLTHNKHELSHEPPKGRTFLGKCQRHRCRSPHSRPGPEGRKHSRNKSDLLPEQPRGRQWTGIFLYPMIRCRCNLRERYHPKNLRNRPGLHFLSPRARKSAGRSRYFWRRPH